MMLHNALCAAALSLTLLAALAEPAQQHRIVPLRAMSEDVDILHGDPDKAGEPFVMRIRELPGTIIRRTAMPRLGPRQARLFFR